MVEPSGPTISVVVPTYLRPESLRRCLESLAAGTERPEEVVVVVREGDEATQEVVRGRRSTEEATLNLRLAFVDRPGQPAALNEGLAAAQGEVIAFIDDDVVVAEDWLARLREAYRDEEAGGVGGRDIVYHDGEVSVEHATVVGRIGLTGRIVGNHHCEGPARQRVWHLKGANMSFRREYLNGFDENFIGGPSCNDTDVSLSAVEAGAVLVYDPAIVVHHHVAPRRDTGGRDAAELETIRAHAHNRAYCLWKHLGVVRRLLYAIDAVLVGQGEGYGVLKAVYRRLQGERRAWAKLRASLRGCRDGIATWGRVRGGRQ